MDQSGATGKSFCQISHGQVEITQLCSNMLLDEADGTVKVGGGTDFKTLIRVLLDHHLVVPVVPALGAITVGDAICGSGKDSTKFRQAFVQAAVQSLEVLLPDGQIISCSRGQYEELFAILTQSQGKSGCILTATLMLVPAETEVLVKLQEFSRASYPYGGMTKATHHPAGGFMERITLGPDSAVTVTGSMLPQELFEANLPKVVLADDGPYLDVLHTQLDASRDAWHMKNASCAFRVWALLKNHCLGLRTTHLLPSSQRRIVSIRTQDGFSAQIRRQHVVCMMFATSHHLLLLAQSHQR